MDVQRLEEFDQELHRVTQKRRGKECHHLWNNCLNSKRHLKRLLQIISTWLSTPSMYVILNSKLSFFSEANLNKDVQVQKRMLITDFYSPAHK
jgi:hypothetical protein